MHLYTDGTVLVSHGGTEMGQGLHTKVCQVAAQAFGIPVEHVYVNDSSTDKVANTIPTAASMSTDLYGMCTLDACRQIMTRLQPYRAKLGSDASLADVALMAHEDRVDLSAHGFYAPDDSRVGFDFAIEKPDDVPADAPENSWKGHPFNYFTQGVAYTEVEIDVLTGNHRTLRSDVLVDVGSSINPAIDIGQIEVSYIPPPPSSFGRPCFSFCFLFSFVLEQFFVILTKNPSLLITNYNNKNNNINKQNLKTGCIYTRYGLEYNRGSGLW